jgi:hypothetical protein
VIVQFENENILVKATLRIHTYFKLGKQCTSIFEIRNLVLTVSGVCEVYNVLASERFSYVRQA